MPAKSKRQAGGLQGWSTRRKRQRHAGFSTTDTQALEDMTSDAVHDMLPHLLDDMQNLFGNMETNSDDWLPSDDKMALATPANDWHHYITKYIAKGTPQYFCTFTTENCVDVD